jgi:hypothetical protein
MPHYSNWKMKIIKYMFTTLVFSLIIILSYTSGVGTSVAQPQNETTN